METNERKEVIEVKYRTVKEAAELYGIPKERIYAEIRAGRLVARVPRGCSRGYRVSDEDMDDWFANGMEVVGAADGGKG